MAKKPLTILFSPVGTLTRTYIAKPDDKAPEGAKFTPDGKYKTSLVVNDLGDLEAAVYAYAKAEFGASYPGDEELQTPWKAGGDDGDQIVLTAKSQFQPSCVDSKAQRMGEGEFPRFGDKGRIKFSLYSYSKSEKVKEGKKVIDVAVFGVSARLLAVQVIERGKGGGGSDGEGFDAVDGGYEAEQTVTPAKAAPRAKPASDDDF